MSDVNRRRTRSQKSDDIEMPNTGDNSSDSDSLDNTIVDMESELDAANATSELKPPLVFTPAQSSMEPPMSSGDNKSSNCGQSQALPSAVAHNMPTQPFATEELFNALLSTMTSLKSAINELRQDTIQNNRQIAGLRSEMKESPQTSLPSQLTDVEKPIQSTSYINRHHTYNFQQEPPKHIHHFEPSYAIHQQPSQQLPASQLSNCATSNTNVPPSHNRSVCDHVQRSIPIHNETPSTNERFTNVNHIPLAPNYMPPLLSDLPTWSHMPQTSTSITNANDMPTRGSDFLTKLYHLPHFDGKPEDWPLFLATYNDTSEEFRYSNRQNLMRLQKALQGAAKESVLSMLIHPENVPHIISELKFNFGRPEMLIKSQMEKVKMYPAIHENRLDGIIGLANCARNIVAFFKSAKCDNHLSNPTLLEQLVLKLPLSKQYEWAKFSCSIVPYPTLKDFSEWIGDLARFCSLMPQRSAVTTTTNDRQQSSTTRRVLHSKEQQPDSKVCQQCKKNHYLPECQQFKELATNDKWEQVKRFRVCFGCLRRGHNLTQCKRRKICEMNGCSRYHHPTLHQQATSRPTDTQLAQPEQRDHVLQCHQNKDTCQLFKILPATLHGPRGEINVYALLDEGSSVSLLEESVARSLGLKGQTSPITLQWYDNMKKTESSMRVNIEISAHNVKAKRYIMTNVHTVKELSLPMQSFNRSEFKYLQHLPIEDYVNKKPSILIGLDHCYLGLAEQVVEAGPNLPVASSTKLGWVAFGPNTNAVNNIARICHISEDRTLIELKRIVEDYFSIENFGVKETDLVLESEENKRARIILQNTTRKIQGRYETGLLWKNDNTVLPESLEMAKQRLYKVEEKMLKDPIYAANYRREINNYISKGYAKLLPSSESETTDHNRIWYLPHFGVSNPHKPDKLRIVFDAAAKSSNVSLNSVLLKGPEHAKPLQVILYQFRQGRVAVAGDIQEMFSQVSIIPADQNSQRFLWRDGNAKRDVQVYVMESMIFGAICSPCCAEYIKNINASQFESTSPRGADAVIRSTYVDDLVISFNCLEDALEVTTQAIDINAAAGFRLRNFSSNCAELEAKLNNGDEGKSIVLNMERQNQTDKILGLYWDKCTDSFEFHVKFHKVSKDVLNGTRSPTKREVLGIVMAIFDPFGFLANFTINSKLLLQRTWKLGLQWDDPLPMDILAKWKSWWKEFDKVKGVSIPRCYFNHLHCADEIQLHVFVDASSSAYAAVAYFPIKHKGNIHISFVTAKSRCAPPKGMTIPRLELQAAVLGCRLRTSIEKSHNLKINSTTFWSDSKTVVLWIRSTEREYKQFVACRIAEILSTSSSDQWRWLPTELNVADDATRANLSNSFDFNSRWLIGPEFLRRDGAFWPTDPQLLESNQGQEEEKAKSILILHHLKPILNLQRFSSFLKMKRCAAWILRFINVYVKKKQLMSNELTSAEIDAGEKLICRLVQAESFASELLCLRKGEMVPRSSEIFQLTPCINDDMLLRVNGRIDNAYCLPETARRPIIMPTKHSVTKAIVTYYHNMRHHQNDHVVVNEVRQKFWIPHIRSVMRTVKICCPVCVRDSAKPKPPLMGQLPCDRLTPYVRPFTYVGLDYCGPFFVAIGRSREKRWIALFTCLTTRALHLEVSVDLSTDAFLICLRNFVNRRGVPVRIRSDNGTNFIGAQKEITAGNRFFDFDEIQRNLSKNNIEWVFNCPANPHAGGCWERLVRCVKRLLYKIFKEEAPRLETFRSAIIEAESIINNRPLTELPISVDSEEPLTPNHFLIGTLSSSQTPGPDEKICLRKQWRIAQNLKDRIWKRWVVEYLPQLLWRTKWREEVKSLQPGNLVMVLDSNQPRSQWKTGRVTKIFVGQDGQVRSAEVKTPYGLLRRPAVKLAVLNFVESSS